MTIHHLLCGLFVTLASSGGQLASAQSTPSAPPKATVEDFRWIVGHWTGTGLGGTSEEMWMPPAAGALPGSFRQIVAGKVTFYEILTFVEREGTVVLRLKHFNADLTGWEEKAQVLEFPLVELTPTRAVFNAMTFVHEDKDAFRVSLRMRDRKTNEVREEIFQYRRVQ